MQYSNNYLNFKNPFQSFLMAGFECADHQNAFGERVDLVKSTAHDRFLNADYELLNQIGIKTVREGIRWSFVEKSPFQYDWSQMEEVIVASKKKGIQVVWDICHFGFPDDLTPLHPMFARRFSHLCKAFVSKYRSLVPDGELIVTPINEVSFLSWLGGDAKGTSPYCINQGWEVKYMLMKAYIEGVERMKEADPTVKIMTTEPLISITASDASDQDCALKAVEKHNEQYQVLEILTGKLCPELRGKPEYLDIIGVNFYYNNQWTYPDHKFIPWNDVVPNPLWRSLDSLVNEVFINYGRPIVLSETSHSKEDRALWLEMISNDCLSLLKTGLPFFGCCIYPIIDRPDWDFTDIWHHSGVWDIENLETMERKVHSESLLTLQKLQFDLKKLVEFV